MLLNAVTGFSWSGPTYVFQFIEALSNGEVWAGLPKSLVTCLTVHTDKEAADVVLQTGKYPGELKEVVICPRGTTMTGVEALEQGRD